VYGSPSARLTSGRRLSARWRQPSPPLFRGARPAVVSWYPTSRLGLLLDSRALPPGQRPELVPGVYGPGTASIRASSDGPQPERPDALASRALGADRVVMRYIAVGTGSVAALDAAVSPPKAREWRIPLRCCVVPVDPA
jgi:hypothetical protein